MPIKLGVHGERLNLLDRLSRTEQADREFVLGRRLLIIVVFLADFVCVAFPVLMRALLSSWIPMTNFWICVWGAAMGVVYSMAVLPSIFFALLDAQWGIRVVGVIATVCASITCISLGMLISGDPEFDLNWFATAGLPVLPAAVTSMALPFVVVRYLLGWQIVIQSRSPSSSMATGFNFWIDDWNVHDCSLPGWREIKSISRTGCRSL